MRRGNVWRTLCGGNILYLLLVFSRVLIFHSGCGGGGSSLAPATFLYLNPHTAPLSIEGTTQGKANIQSALNRIQAGSPKDYAYVLEWTNVIREMSPSGAECPPNAFGCAYESDRLIVVRAPNESTEDYTLESAIVHEAAHIEFFSRMSGALNDVYKQSQNEDERHSNLHELWYGKRINKMTFFEPRFSLVQNYNRLIGLSDTDYSHRFYNPASGAMQVGGDDNQMMTPIP